MPLKSRGRTLQNRTFCASVDRATSESGVAEGAADLQTGKLAAAEWRGGGGRVFGGQDPDLKLSLTAY